MSLSDFISDRHASPSPAETPYGMGADPDVERVRAFWRRVERYPAGVQVGGESDREGSRKLVIVSGWACELRILADGRRQIFGFLLPGDTIHTGMTADLGIRGIMTLTRLQVVDAAGPAEPEPAMEAFAAAMWRKEERLYDQMVRIGRLTARERILNLLLELYERLEKVGLARDDTFRIPLTQELFADTLGLSLVHISRTLKALRQDGSITLKGGAVTLHRRERLKLASFYHSPRECFAPAQGALRHQVADA